MSIKVVEVVAIHSELSDQVQIDELYTVLQKGFRIFTDIGSGICLLSKEKLKLSTQDEKHISRAFRFGKDGVKQDILLENKEDNTLLELYIYRI